MSWSWLKPCTLGMRVLGRLCQCPHDQYCTRHPLRWHRLPKVGLFRNNWVPCHTDLHRNSTVPYYSIALRCSDRTKEAFCKIWERPQVSLYRSDRKRLRQWPRRSCSRKWVLACTWDSSFLGRLKGHRYALHLQTCLVRRCVSLIHSGIFR